MEVILEALHVLSIGIGVIGAGVIVWGVLCGLLMLIRMELGKFSVSELPVKRRELRVHLGYYLLLGLEFLVAADIIETLSAPTLEHLAILGGVVVIRTIISFSLNWELAREAEETVSITPQGARA